MRWEVEVSRAISIGVIAFSTTLMLPVQLAAQNQHHHYQVVQVPTFGGPSSFFAFLNLDGKGLNDSGTVGASAGTTLPDPYSPPYQLDNGVVPHALLWNSPGGPLTDLGALPGNSQYPHNGSLAYWISENGIVAGFSENGKIDPTFPPLPELQAVIWQNSKLISLGDAPDGGLQSVAISVNKSGQVAGLYTNLVPDGNNSLQQAYGYLWGVTPFQTRGFFWDGHKMQDLGTLGGTDTVTVRINDLGQVIGASYISSNPGACADGLLPIETGGFIWDQTHGMVNLGGFGGTCTSANDINNSGQVVGQSYVTGDKIARAFIWQNGSMQDLGGFPNETTDAVVINDLGWVAGFSLSTGAALWKGVGQVTSIGHLPGDTFAFAGDVNIAGQVVGGSSDHKGALRGFLWENGSIADLNDLIPQSSPLFIADALNINDQGEIAVDAVDAAGNDQAAILIPCDANHPNIPGCDYSLVAPSVMTSARTAPVRRSTMPSLLGRRIRFSIDAAQPQN